MHVGVHSSHPVDVRVVDFGEEVHLRGDHGIVLRKEQLQSEDSSLIAAALRPLYGDVEVAGVVRLGDGGDAGDGILSDSLGLLYYATGKLLRTRHGGGEGHGRGRKGGEEREMRGEGLQAEGECGSEGGRRESVVGQWGEEAMTDSGQWSCD